MNSKIFEYTPANQLDGSPYEVAAAACDQAAAVANLLCDAISGAYDMARVAEMEREMKDGFEPQERCPFHDTALGKRIDTLGEKALNIETDLKIIKRAASYNPEAVDDA